MIYFEMLLQTTLLLGYALHLFKGILHKEHEGRLEGILLAILFFMALAQGFK